MAERIQATTIIPIIMAGQNKGFVGAAAYRGPTWADHHVLHLSIIT